MHRCCRRHVLFSLPARLVLQLLLLHRMLLLLHRTLLLLHRKLLLLHRKLLQPDTYCTSHLCAWKPALPNCNMRSRLILLVLRACSPLLSQHARSPLPMPQPL